MIKLNHKVFTKYITISLFFILPIYTYAQSEFCDSIVIYYRSFNADFKTEAKDIIELISMSKRIVIKNKIKIDSIYYKLNNLKRYKIHGYRRKSKLYYFVAIRYSSGNPRVLFEVCKYGKIYYRDKIYKVEPNLFNYIFDLHLDNYWY